MKPLNPADYPTYNIGAKVTIRQWEDMESEFGLNELGNIKVPKIFTETMKKYCGQTLPIIHVCRYVPPEFDSYYLDGSANIFFLLLCLNNPNPNPFRLLLFPLILFSKVVISFDSRNN